jgi:hypothetical protein
MIKVIRMKGTIVITDKEDGSDVKSAKSSS